MPGIGRVSERVYNADDPSDVDDLVADMLGFGLAGPILREQGGMERTCRSCGRMSVVLPNIEHCYSCGSDFGPITFGLDKPFER